MDANTEDLTSDNKKNKALFHDVIFDLDPLLWGKQRSQLRNDLLKYGAKYYQDEKRKGHFERVTHYISNRIRTVEAKHLVTPEWVATAIRNGYTHKPGFYYPDATRVLTGTVVTTSGIPECDRETIFGVANALGAQYRYKMDDDVTHLVCIAPEGEMYEEALGPRIGTVKVVLPHWLNECFRLRRFVQEDIYLFPDPLYYVTDHNPLLTDSTGKIDSTDPVEVSSEYGSARLASNLIESDVTTIKEGNTATRNSGPALYAPMKIEQLAVLTLKGKVFDGKMIYLHSDLGLTPEYKERITQLLEKAGATVKYNYDAIKKDNDASIAIFKYRGSDLYMQACQEGKTVANLTWIVSSLRFNRVESPLSSIWFHPFPRGGIPGMEKLTATVTGYAEEARLLIFMLCTLVGIQFAPDLTDNTTHIICSSRTGTKYHVGRLRNCDIVNHLWLEECYQQWERKSVADERYTYFPGNNILQSIVGSTPLVLAELDKWSNKDTWPEIGSYIPAHLLLNKRNSLNDDDDDSEIAMTSMIAARRARQAALDANSHLHDVIIPDMNRYQKGEKRSLHSSNTLGSKQRPSPCISSRAASSPPVKRFKAGHSMPDDTPREISPMTSSPSPKPSSHNDFSPSPVDTTSPITPSTSTKSSSLTSSAQSQQPSSVLTRENKSVARPSRMTMATATTTEAAEGEVVDRIESESTDVDSTTDDESEMPSRAAAEAGVSATDSSTQDKKAKSALPEVSPRHNNIPGKIASSGVELTGDEEKGIRKLGSQLVNDIRKADSLIVPDRILRTPKILCAINLGIPIVNTQWLKVSLDKKVWQNPLEYLVEDGESESKYGFVLRKSLESARESLSRRKKGNTKRQGTWLHGYEVCVLQSGKDNIWKDVVETAGGKYIPVPNRRVLEAMHNQRQDNKQQDLNLLVLADKDDRKRKSWDDIRKFGIKIYNKDLVVIGSFKQRLLLDDFVLT